MFCCQLRYFKRKAEEQDEKSIKNKKGDQGEGEEELEEESDMGKRDIN